MAPSEAAANSCLLLFRQAMRGFDGLQTKVANIQIGGSFKPFKWSSTLHKSTTSYLATLYLVINKGNIVSIEARVAAAAGTFFLILVPTIIANQAVATSAVARSSSPFDTDRLNTPESAAVRPPSQTEDELNGDPLDLGSAASRSGSFNAGGSPAP